MSFGQEWISLLKIVSAAVSLANVAKTWHHATAYFPTGVSLCTMAEYLYGFHSRSSQVEQAHPDLGYSRLLP
jgi:hypothetical protein